MPTNTIRETIHNLRILNQQVQECAELARQQNMLQVALLQEDLAEALDDAIEYLTDLDKRHLDELFDN